MCARLRERWIERDLAPVKLAIDDPISSVSGKEREIFFVFVCVIERESVCV